MSDQMVEPGNGERSENNPITKNTHHPGTATKSQPNDNSLPILHHQQELAGPSIPSTPRKDQTSCRTQQECDSTTQDNHHTSNQDTHLSASKLTKTSGNTFY